MITDDEIFKERWVPHSLPHRNAEADALSAALQPLVDGRALHPVTIHGDSGSGKTCVTRHLARELETEEGLQRAYVNCWEERERAGVLYQVLGDIGQVADVHRDSTAGDVIRERIRERARERSAVVILDEIDQLREPRALYELARSDGIGLVLICNDLNRVLTSWEPRVVNRIRGRSIEFPGYSLDALVDILEARAEKGLVGGAVETDVLEAIADRAAGDAHKAVRTLYHAADLAVEHGELELAECHVEPAFETAKVDLQRHRARYLTRHQWALLEVVIEAGEITPGELYPRYRSRVRDPLTDRSVRNNLQKLEEYSMIDIEGETSGRVYQKVEGAERILAMREDA